MAHPYFNSVPNSKLDSIDAANAYLDGCIETLSTLISEESSDNSKTLYLTVLNLETVKDMIKHIPINKE